MLESKQIFAYDDPSKTFLGVRFVLLGFDSHGEEKVRLKLLEGGGVDAVNYGPDCNHVIVDKIVYDDPICVAARRDGKTLVAGLWVDHSYDLGMPVDPTSVMYRPMRDLNGIPGAKSLIVCLTGYQRQDRDDIMTMVSLMGANFSKPLVANKVTHLICYKYEGEKYELAKKMKTIKLVNHRWLEDCLKAWELLPEADYSKSGQELEMEAEAKDSEGETEDVAAVLEMGRKNVVSPQNTRVDNIRSHQSPAKEDVSRNKLHLSASKSLRNVGDANNIHSTPGKEINFEKTLFPQETHDKHLEMTSFSSGRSPGIMSSEVPSKVHGSTMIYEKGENALASVSARAKMSPNADTSKLSSGSHSLSNPRKSSLPLWSERIGSHLGSPASNVNSLGAGGSFGTDLDGVKTPSKGTPLNVDEVQTVILSYKRKKTLSHDVSRSPISSHDPKKLMESEMLKKTTEGPVSGTSVVGSRVLAGHNSPTVVACHLREEEASKTSVTSEDGQEFNELVQHTSGVLKRTSSKTDNSTGELRMHQNEGTPLHIDEGQTITLSNKRKKTLSRGASRSPILSPDPKKLMESETLKKTNEGPVAGTSVVGSRVLAGHNSPTVVACHLREEEASVAPEEASKTSVTSEDGQEFNDQAVQHTSGVSKRTSSKTDNSTGELRMHQNEGTPLHVDEGQTITLSNKRKKSLPPGASRSPILSPDPKKLMKSEMLKKTTEGPVSGASVVGPRVLAGHNSPTVVACHLREEEASKTSVTSEDGQEHNDQAVQHPSGGTKRASSRTDNSTGKLRMHQNDMESIEPPFPRTDPSLENMDCQDDLNLSKVGCTSAQLKPLKRTMLAKKTLGRSTICKTKNHEGSSSLRKAGLQIEYLSHSNGEAAKEDTDNPTITEKTAMVPPTTDQDGPMDGKAKVSDEKVRIEFDGVSDKDKSAEVEAPRSRKRTISTKKQAVGSKNSTDAAKVVCSKENNFPESKSMSDAEEKKLTKGKKRPLTKLKTNKLEDHREEVEEDARDEKETVSANQEPVALAGKTKARPSKKSKSSSDLEKENKPATIREQSLSSGTGAAEKVACQPLTKPLKNGSKAEKANKGTQDVEVKTEPAWFILSGHKLQRKEFQQVIKRLKGRVCRDSHHWSYQATHFIVPDPVRRTEKFFAAAASGSWILKTDYLTASNEAGRFLSEEPYEWHKKCLTEDGAINLEAPRKWRLLRERTGHGAFCGMRIVIYGECIAPPLDTLKRVVKAGDGTILATSPPYTRFLQSGIDFAIVSPGMPRVDMWVQEFLRHEVPCVVADYLVEYVCKPGYSLERHVQYSTHAWAKKSLDNLVNRVEVCDDPQTPDHRGITDDVACRVCGSRDRGEEMLICGDKHGSRGCGVGVHIDCLDPPLEDVPEEDWFCSDCSQKRETKSVSKSSKKRASKSKK